MNAAADLHRIQAYLRVAAPRGRAHVTIGPFLATFNRTTSNPYLNYAIPDDDATPTRSDIDRLVAAYRERDRRPRLEYIPAVAPAVEPALVAAGFDVELRTPLMMHAGRRADATREPEGIALVVATADEDLRAAASVQWDAYEDEAPMTDRADGGLRTTLEAGGIVVLAREAATREPAGAGLCTGPYDRTTELAAVGVRKAFRRRGIAEAIARRLTDEAIAIGADNVFLMAEGPAEARIYARAGFVQVSEVLHTSLA
jgi:ribosomal protein S18 acetylase RimI-like enzyme